MVKIERVLPGSIAAGLDLQAGDSLVSINNHEVSDGVEYRFFISDERVSFTVRQRNGESRVITVDKDPDDDLGIECSPFRVMRCKNRCIFCFVDQMPTGCRPSLYVKDEDFRASFLYGNYITLSVLSEADWTRIFHQRLSPLYISVHTTDPGLRSFMLGNRKTPDILESMKRLAQGGIRMHTQIVLCPGINDGPHLLKTINDLSDLFPSVASIAVVPVGLTAHRKGLFPLRTFTRKESRDVLVNITELGSRFKKKHGTRLVFPSDEFYIKAGIPVPRVSFYEDFPQIENGVGMVANFLSEVSHTKLPKRLPPIKATLVTGVSFGRILGNTLTRVRNATGAIIRQVIVQNNFFGPSVTVAGLLAGQDILHTLTNRRLGDLVMVPAEALKQDSDIFLDDMSLAQLSKKLKTRVVPVEGFRHLITILRTAGSKSS